jgi:hypothetical protein
MRVHKLIFVTLAAMSKTLFILSSLFVCAHALAQSGYYLEDPKVFNGGIIAGANFTQVDGDTYYGYHKVGLNVGAVVYVHFTEKFGASMELDYTQKGSRGESVSNSVSIGQYVEKYFMDLNYAEVPVTLHYKTHKIDIEAGVSYARLINSKEWVLTDQPVVIDPVANRFNTNDIDYIIGAARQVYKNLYVNARFQYSIISIRPAERVPYGFGYGSDGQFNNMLNLRLIYLF